MFRHHAGRFLTASYNSVDLPPPTPSELVRRRHRRDVVELLALATETICIASLAVLACCAVVVA